ncbi:MAG: hypothetical protein EBR00_11275 [Gammaproteobacteria bacterium]|nr:hypothetical protein [Gammaproteobacteria bacterium]
MSQRFRIDGVEYTTDSLSQEGRDLVVRLTFVRLQQQELSNQIALLTKAKNAYISDLKTEIIQGRTGVDLGSLFSED